MKYFIIIKKDFTKFDVKLVINFFKQFTVIINKIIFRKYCINIPWKYCKISKILRNLSLILLKYCNDLAMSAQNMTYAIFEKYYQKLQMHKQYFFLNKLYRILSLDFFIPIIKIQILFYNSKRSI